MFFDLVVARTLVEPLQHLPRSRGHVRTLVVLTGETPRRLPGIEPHDRDELDLALVLSIRLTEKLNPLVSGNVLAGDLREDLRLEQSLVFVCVLGFRIPAPNPADHLACASSRLPMSWSRSREPSARSSPIGTCSGPVSYWLPRNPQKRGSLHARCSDSAAPDMRPGFAARFGQG